jgi:hypothetical protein
MQHAQQGLNGEVARPTAQQHAQQALMVLARIIGQQA